MKIYIDGDYKCHPGPGEGLRPVEAAFFRNAAPAYLEGYRFIPSGESRTGEDGTVFVGEMAAPWKDWEGLDRAQRVYERAQNEQMLDAMASMVEAVYDQDMAEIQGEDL